MRKHIDISRTVQFFDALKGSITIAPEEDCPPTLTLTITLNQTPTLTGGQFSSGAIIRTPL